MTERRKVAVVTGGSSGIGAASVRRLAAEGYAVITGARRLERLRAVTEPVGAAAHVLDVTDPGSVAAFAAAVAERAPAGLALLVNNAGGALGLDPVEKTRDEQWEWMFQANVLGTLRMTRALLPALIASGDGHIVNIGSIAGFETYPGGAGYTAAKHALRALTRTLRLELLGHPVRVTDVAPGLVETEFSAVRFDGDQERAEKVYEGMTPLTADDVADCVAWAATRPSHVNIDELVVRPRDQATATMVHRQPAHRQPDDR
ncbi:MAG: SDR family NAD(P)-dependent oxidoreductase [bacterium]|nr:SDR family NAD(P)-dependent oxidoreductase [bacterium]